MNKYNRSKIVMGEWSRKVRSAFTMIELLSVMVVVSVVASLAVFYVGHYMVEVRRLSNKQTLVVLNDALTRYKTQGGGVAAFTAGASIGGVLNKLSTPVTWGGQEHKFLSEKKFYDVKSMRADGLGVNYMFTKYGIYYTDLEARVAAILEKIKATGVLIVDLDALKKWIETAILETNSDNFMLITGNSASFRMRMAVVDNSDEVRVWWRNRDTEILKLTTTPETVVKNYPHNLDRLVIIVGDLAYLEGLETDEEDEWTTDIDNMTCLEHLVADKSLKVKGNIDSLSCLTHLILNKSDNARVDVSKLPDLTHLESKSPGLTGDLSGLLNLVQVKAEGNNSLSGDISGLTKLTDLIIGGNNTVTGDITNLKDLIQLKVEGNNSLSGDISGLTKLTELTLGGKNTVTGDISKLVNLKNVKLTGEDCSIYGDIDKLENLITVDISNGKTNIGGSVSEWAAATPFYLMCKNCLPGGISNMASLKKVTFSNGILGGWEGVAADSAELESALRECEIQPFTQDEINEFFVNLWKSYKSDKRVGMVRFIDNSGNPDPTGAAWAALKNLEKAGWNITY